MNGREVAWRVFAGELNDSSLVEKGEEERAPSYVITPLGARINRVYIVGVITDLENVGSPEEPIWRARIADPSGTTFVSAGQFQPEAALALSKIPVPSFAAIIGKVRVYSPEDGVMYLSISPEVVKQVDKEMRDSWVLDSARALKHRLEGMSEAQNMSSPSVDELVDLEFSNSLAMGIVSAIDHYGDIPMERYRAMLLDSVRYLIPEEGGGSEELPEPASESEPEKYEDMENYDKPPEPPVMEPKPEKADEPEAAATSEDETPIDSDEELTDDEEKLIRLINKMDPESGGMDWDELEKASKKDKMKKEVFEEAMEGLLDKGLVYEPMLGKIRKI
ncbi:MAG: hypothetical protein KAJ33_01005 [Thermoplasmata archaeon]|nr:hypothetical protein [Thermoplasmata archaeon]